MRKKNDSRHTPHGTTPSGDGQQAVFGRHEARAFLEKNNFPVPRNACLTDQICATLYKVSKHIELTGEEIKTLNVELDKARKKAATTAARLKSANATIKEQAKLLSIDIKTGVSSEFALSGEIARLVARRDRSERRKGKDEFPTACVVMFDLDDFKRINTEYSHSGGNEALSHVADMVKEKVRDGDMVGRWGGDEFMAILYNVSEEDAKRIAEELRTAVQENMISRPNVNGSFRMMPISITCATHQISPGDTVEDIETSLSEQLLKQKQDKPRYDKETETYSNFALREEIRRAALRQTMGCVPVDRSITYATHAIGFDIDTFKSLNEEFGPDACNEALRHIAALTKKRLGLGDIAGRWGDDEFMIITYDRTQAQAEEILRDLQKAVADNPLVRRDSKGELRQMPIRITGAIHEITANDAPETVAASLGSQIGLLKQSSPKYSSLVQAEENAARQAQWQALKKPGGGFVGF